MKLKTEPNFDHSIFGYLFKKRDVKSSTTRMSFRYHQFPIKFDHLFGNTLLPYSPARHIEVPEGSTAAPK